MANPNLKCVVKTSTTLSLKGTLDSDTGEIMTEDDKFDLMVLLSYFENKEIDLSFALKGCSLKFKGILQGAEITTEEGDTFDVLEMIRPFGYMEVKVNAKCVEEEERNEE